ncbi:hypothetical protein [Flagellimonas beolgyonensis]|jgi:hypothetical protein|uniref:hypothetical protein n=1 Tax=Flagellimonas beolgyonensis TaxID=864064 RepID=UPI0032589369
MKNWNVPLSKPHILFFGTTALVLLIGLFYGETEVDLNIHDTYFIIALNQLALLTALYFGIIGLAFWLFHKSKRQLSRWLTFMHLGFTYGGSLVILILSQFYREDVLEYNFNNTLTMIIMVLLLFIIIAQLMVPINLGYGLIRNNNSRISKVK